MYNLLLTASYFMNFFSIFISILCRVELNMACAHLAPFILVHSSYRSSGKAASEYSIDVRTGLENGCQPRIRKGMVTIWDSRTKLWGVSSSSNIECALRCIKMSFFCNSDAEFNCTGRESISINQSFTFISPNRLFPVCAPFGIQ